MVFIFSNFGEMKMLTLAIVTLISVACAESEGASKSTGASCCLALSARLDRLEDMLKTQMQDKLENMIEKKLEDMLEKRMGIYQRKAEEYANDAVQVARKELIKSERFIVKVADDSAEQCTSKVNGLETKLSKEVDAAEEAASEHRRTIEEQIASTPSKEVVEDVAARLRRLETNSTAEFKVLYKAVKDSAEQVNIVASQANKTEETIRSHKSLVDSQTNRSVAEDQSLKTQINEIAQEVRTSAQTFAPERRAQVYMNIAAAADGVTSGSGCATVSLSSSKVFVLSNNQACNSLVCPSCWIITAAHATYKLSLQGCSTAHISPTVQLKSTTGFTSAMRTYTIINADESTAAIVCDGAGTPNCVTIAAKKAIEAVCYTDATTQNTLYYPS